MAADYDGDGITDVAAYRPSTGQWYVIKSLTGFIQITTWGIAGDRPTAADYDGDGKADLAVFRPSTGTWYIVKSTGGELIRVFGQNGDIPVPGAYY